MPKPISLKKHITPGVVIKTPLGVFEVIGVTKSVCIGIDNKGELMAFDYNAPNMTVYQRVSDNNLPFS